LEQLYLPPDFCGDCHTQEYESYLASGHSHALKTLYDKGQLYNPDCMRCHVVYDSYTDELKCMNCVFCHSNISEWHVREALNEEVVRPDPPVTAYTFDWCVRCHDEVNSSQFADHWPQYVKRIYHGGDMSAAEETAKALGLDLDAPIPDH